MFKNAFQNKCKISIILPLFLPFRKPLIGFEQKEQLEILEYLM